ncbi:MAG: uroporphyrinogen decarboxylase [Myxococcales bacterium]|nr:uroporphyrinogen decarboxylase [Myxococcales bacterium]
MPTFTPRTRFLAALSGAPVDRPPVWLMRQAGRYLPEYRAVRAEHGFLEMVHTPALAAEVTLQPVRRFDVDAAILFSDILTVPEALGVTVDFPDGGPTLRPLVRTAADLDRLDPSDMKRKLAYVGDALRATRAGLGNDHALLGFAGAPWTLACYLVEGQGSKSYEHIRTLVYRDPAMLRRLLDLLADAVADLLCLQLEAGADAVQLFDSWAGELRSPEYTEFVLPSTVRIVQRVHAAGGKVILFARHPGHLLDASLQAGADAYGLDGRIDLAHAARSATRPDGSRPALQGNLDPVELFAPAAHIARRVREMHEATGGRGWIANLGHGVTPQTPIEGVAAFVAAVGALTGTAP